mmetsp:Transcript_8827/g.17836  ORF Transcript_8827/g.17836 Transcript_8827/m.17836 type:complete len:403 (-) Transcript_8827:488-1696(-)
MMTLNGIRGRKRVDVEELITGPSAVSASTTTSGNSFGSDEVVSDAVRMVGRGPCSRRYFDVSIAASGLSVEPRWEVWVKMEMQNQGGERTLIGSTESIAYDPNPNFVSSFAVVSDSLRVMDQEVILTVMRRVRRRGATLRGKESSLGSASFMFRELLRASGHSLFLLLTSPVGMITGLLLVSGEEFRSRDSPPDMISLQFQIETSLDPDDTKGYFFVMSRAIKSRTEKWRRVYCSSIVESNRKIGGTVGITEIGSVSTGTLFADDVDRKILLELYRVTTSEGVPQLCGSAKTSIRTLTQQALQFERIAMNCDRGGLMESGCLAIQPGTTLGKDSGGMNSIFLKAKDISWYSSGKARDAVRAQQAQAELNARFPRLAETGTDLIGSVLISQEWVGSSLRTLIL